MAKASLDYTFTAHTTAKGTEAYANDTALANAVNDIIDEQINASADIDGSKLKDGTVEGVKLSTSALLNTQGFVNLIENGHFLDWSAGTDTFPTGWVDDNTVSAVEQGTKPAGPAGYSVKITTDGALQGIKQTGIACRASTVYAIALYEKVTAGDTIRVIVADNGGTPTTETNDYTDTSWARQNITITTASDATALSIKIEGKSSGDIVWAGEVIITEGNLLKQFTPDIVLSSTASVRSEETYTTGTVAVTEGSADIVGTNTLWIANVSIGNASKVDSDGTWYQVKTITDNTHITLESNYAGTTASGEAYTIEDSYKTDTVYQNETSKKLCIVAFEERTTGDGWSGISGFVGSSSPPGTKVAHSEGNGLTEGMICFLVPPAYYFKVVLRDNSTLQRYEGWEV